MKTVNFGGYLWTIRDNTSYEVYDLIIDDKHICCCWFPNHTYAWWHFGEKGSSADTLYLATKYALNSIGLKDRK
jgi:hypothetical protein